MFVLLLGFFSCVEKPNNPLDNDNDGDGFSEFDGDCDDSNPKAYPGVANLDSTELCMVDNDGDGYGDDTIDSFPNATGHQGTDCDDGSAVTFPGSAELESTEYCMKDQDGDGYGEQNPTSSSGGFVQPGTDCDDGDGFSTFMGEDADCDDVLSVDDCDDADASMPNNDMDCDGVLTADDCDDANAVLLAQSDDMDCDGILTIDDCDDFDANVSYCLELGGGQMIELVNITAGTFMMGSPPDTIYIVSGSPLLNEDQHLVTLTNDFLVSTTELTQGMYNQLMGYQAYDEQGPNAGAGDDHPAYYVSWHMAADFSNKLTEQHNSLNGTSLTECYSCSDSGTTSVSCSTAVTPIYDCTGYRLLTEAEWEHAARAGTTAAFWTSNGGGDLPSSWSDGTTILSDGFDLTTYGWYSANNSPTGSKEVATLIPNDNGLYDTSGNLWEWTHDTYTGSLGTGATTDPVRETDSDRVIRGGGWNSNPLELRSARRFNLAPEDRYGDIGFRIGRSNPQ